MNLNVTYHQQDLKKEDSYCGAAAAQMVLHTIGAGHFDQDDLFKTSHITGDSIPWHSAPDGLCSTIETHKPSGFPVTFTMWPTASIDAMSRKVCWSIFNYKLPAIVLLNGSHWVVVTGYEASDDPEDSDDTSYEISRFYVHNPEPATSGDPPPHTNIDIDDMDDHCRDRGTVDEEIEYFDWKRMNHCMAGNWRNSYIVICDPDSPAETQDDAREDLGDVIDELADIRSRANGELISRANRGLTDAELLLPSLPEDDPHELPGERFLIERVDFDPHEYYYIVPVWDPAGGISLLVNVSAHEKGRANGSVAASGPTSRFARALSREAIISTFAGKKIVVSGTTVEPKEEELHRYLVWQPCLESLSPYLPFYRFDIGGEDGETKLYVRIDGEPFLELHVEMGM
jgi:hypothetical protein